MLNAPTRSELDELSAQPLLSMLYVSRATELFRPEDLYPLLTMSRAKNWIRNLTGVLLVDNGRFLHYLEGPVDAVGERMGRIRADERHTHLSPLCNERISQRLFPRWTMANAPLTEMDQEIPALRRVFAEPESPLDAAIITTAVTAVAGWFARQPDAIAFSLTFTKGSPS